MRPPGLLFQGEGGPPAEAGTLKELRFLHREAVSEAKMGRRRAGCGV